MLYSALALLLEYTQTSCGYDVYDLVSNKQCPLLCSSQTCQWDLGEFEQKGGIGTRWGTKKELLQACQVARQHGVDIIIDAVLNVCLDFLFNDSFILF